MPMSKIPLTLDTPGDRLRSARAKAGYRSARAAAQALGWRVSSYNAHERAGAPGARMFGIEEANRYGQSFQVSPAWLLTGEGAPSRMSVAAVVGYTGAGAEVYAIDDHERGAALEEIELPFPVPEGAVAVIVRGDSMWPRYDEGDVIVYQRRGEPVSELIGRECVLKLADGRVFIKWLRRSPESGRYTLDSVSAKPIENADVDWAGQVLYVARSGQWRKIR